MKPKFCDYCNYEVEKRGKIEPEWVHKHGSVFCLVTVATVSGKHFLKREVECNTNISLVIKEDV